LNGLGLLIIEQSFVSQGGRCSEQQIGINDDVLVHGLKILSNSIHSTGTTVVVQINHTGGRADTKVTGMQPVAPSPTGSARGLQVKEIEALIEAFALGAERAVKAGFDGVEVHGAHGFLLNQFFSPLTNRRHDNYGGSLRNRMRLPLEVIERVREKVGGKLLLYRLGSDDLAPAGTVIGDSQKFATKLREAGVDIIDVSGGLCGGTPAQLLGRQGFFIPQAYQIKSVVDIPVIGVGGIAEPEFADRLIQEGKVDLVAVGRKLLEDPDWAMKAIEILQKK
jgi:2,4-dienoyl-CoA reductase-like NADH-dependent reductase (Old Yellow Enzyme family)